MTTIKTWTWGAAAALALDIITACEPAVEASQDDDAAISFRDGGWGPGKLNTHFLGKDEAFPLNAIPLQDDPTASIRLHAVWTNKCASVTGQNFYTSDLDGELGITLTEEGDLNPAVFKLFGNPSVQCTIAGNAWIGTVWGIIYNNQNFYLMIKDRIVQPNGRILWLWGRYTGGPQFSEKSYQDSCLMDQEPDGLYEFYAYHFKDLDVADDGNFTYSPDTMYIGCLSGAVGKTKTWGFGMPDVSMETHEMVTRIARADYCGDGKSYTFEGNPVQIDDVDGDLSEFDDLTYPDEAAWSLELGRATCVSVPRHLPLRPTWGPLNCSEDLPPELAITLTPCTEEDVADATFMTKIAHQ